MSSRRRVDSGRARLARWRTFSDQRDDGGEGALHESGLLTSSVGANCGPSLRSRFRLLFPPISGGLAAVLLAGFVGAAGPAEEAAANHVLRGVVQTVDGQPVADAPVYLVAHLSVWGASPWAESAERLETVARVRTSRADFDSRCPLRGPWLPQPVLRPGKRPVPRSEWRRRL